MRRIESEADLEEGVQWLSRQEPRFREAYRLVGSIPLRRRKDGFEALMDAIVGQQVSVAAGDAIWGRLKKAKLTGPRKVLHASEEELRACGLSRQKITYSKALAEARIDYRALRELATEEVVEILTKVKGIGQWTAEIYCLFSLGHADAFASRDLALQESARILFELEARPDEKELRALSEHWSPWRGVAARLLWSYYRVAKEREGTR